MMLQVQQESWETEKTYIDENRINAVVNAVKRRIQNLEQIIRERQSEIFVHSYSSTEDDVEENVAEDYSPKGIVFHGFFEVNRIQHFDFVPAPL